MAKNTIENGRPNRKRMLVAPQVPRRPVRCRCIALRATWPDAAMIVKGIQSEAIVNMCDERNWPGGSAGAPCRYHQVRSTDAAHDCPADRNTSRHHGWSTRPQSPSLEQCSIAQGYRDDSQTIFQS